MKRWAHRQHPAIALLAIITVAACSGAPDDGSTPFLSTPSAAPTARPDTRASPDITPAPSATPELGAAPIGPTETGTVLSITDGDTIRVDRGFGSEPVRYIGMNTPEVGDPGGAEATAENARLVEGMQVVLERDVSETDQFDRLLRYIWIESGNGWTFVNLALVARGFAQAATYPPDVRYADLFLTTEGGARSAGVGLWAATPAPTLAPDPTAARPEPTEAAARCHPSYTPCLPIVADLDCPDVRAMGAAPVTVIGPDDYRLDGNHDGVGCE
jgi:micrococcal nuclease